MGNFNLSISIILILLIGACAKPSSQFYDSVPKLLPMADQGLFSKAVVHQKKGQIKLAIKLWKKFLDIYPDAYEARNNLGLLYYADDQITMAIAQFEKGLQLESGSAKIQGNLLRALKVRVAILGENKKYDEAIKDLMQITQLSPIKEREKISRQIESFEDKIFEQVKRANSVEEYQKFLEKYPNSPKNSDEAKLWIEKTQRSKESKVNNKLSSPKSFISGEARVDGGSLNDETTQILKKPIQEEGEPIIFNESDESDAESTLPEAFKLVEVISSKVINVHSEPKIEIGNIIHQLRAGVQLIYTDEKEGWYQVEFASGQKGWIIKRYAKLLE